MIIANGLSDYPSDSGYCFLIPKREKQVWEEEEEEEEEEVGEVVEEDSGILVRLRLTSIGGFLLI